MGQTLIELFLVLFGDGELNIPLFHDVDVLRGLGLGGIRYTDKLEECVRHVLSRSSR